jgi:hypothetical protein
LPDETKVVMNVALPLTSGAVAGTTVPPLNVTVPLGVPSNSPVTVAVNITDWVAMDGFRLEAKAVLVLARFTVCDKTDELLGEKFVSPP